MARPLFELVGGEDQRRQSFAAIRVISVPF
jgi:hypothetical protein